MLPRRVFVSVGVATALTLPMACQDAPVAPAPDETVGQVRLLATKQTMEETEVLLLRADVISVSGRLLTDRSVTWSSDDAAVARVDSSGALLGVGPGEVTIKAAVGQVEDTRRFSVLGPDSLQLDVPGPVEAGDTIRLVARAFTPSSRSCDAGIVVWLAADPGVATIDATGLLSGVRPGKALVTATARGMTAAVTATVKQAAGTIHTGAAGDTVWRAVGYPHILQGVARVPRLRLEPGVEVRVEAGGGVVVGLLDARGTAALPIRFFSDAGTGGWSGVRISSGAYPVSGAPTSDLEHVRIEDADVAIQAEHPVEMRNVAVLRTASDGVVLSSGTVRELTVDSAGGTGVRILSYNAPGLTLEAARVRWAEGKGIYLQRRSSLTLVGSEILESGAIGLHQDSEAFTLRVREGIRISGGSSYPAYVYSSVLTGLLPDASSHTALTGNALDTLLVMGNGSTGPLVIRPELPWAAQGGTCAVCAQLGSVELRPGAFLRVGNGILRAQLSSSATADAPATVQGSPNWTNTLVLAGDGQPLRNVAFSWLVVTGEGTWPLNLADLTIIDGKVDLAPPNSTLSSASLVGAQLVLRAGAAARNVQLRDAPADGVLVRGAGAILTDCVVTGSGGHGVLVDSGTVRVERCNLEGNTGVGINNLTADTVDARGNWWGDAAGPLGPLGDGVLGPVNFLPFLGAPLTFTGAVLPAASAALALRSGRPPA